MDKELQNKSSVKSGAEAGRPDLLNEQDIYKEYSKLTLTNNFMFCKVMSNPDVCKEFLETMLKIKIDRLEYINSEQEISEVLGMKSVRLDVYVDDGTRMFDIEMQMVDNKDLAKRARFYQSILDTSQFKKGMLYMQLKESYVIFLMPDDHFKHGLSCYTFENICRENPKIKLDDKTTKIFYNFNDYAKETDEEVRDILKYFATGTQTGGVTNRMQDLLEEAWKNSAWLTDYIMYEHNRRLIAYEAEQKGYENGKTAGYNDGIEEGRQVGLQQGLQEGRKEGLQQGLQQGLQEGRQEGRQEGLQQGLRQARIETAQNLLKMGLTLEQVAQGAGLSLDEVSAINTENLDF